MIAYNVAIAVTILICIPIYFLPTIIAAIRGHTNLLALFMLNFLVGVAFLGWAIAMVWACWNTAPQVHKHIHYHD